MQKNFFSFIANATKKILLPFFTFPDGSFWMISGMTIKFSELVNSDVGDLD